MISIQTGGPLVDMLDWAIRHWHTFVNIPGEDCIVAGR